MSKNGLGQSRGETATIEETQVAEPPRYRVLLHNDDYTSQVFVVEILQRIFHKNVAEATEIMLTVHNKGIGICGIYTREIAETRVRMVRHDARLAGFPLLCTMEKV